MMNFGFGYPMMGWSFGWFGWIFMILWWAVVILAIVFLIRWIAKLGNKKEGKALEILKERLARGEISKQEYEELKKEIEKN
jgi:putative membrane protein